MPRSGTMWRVTRTGTRPADPESSSSAGTRRLGRRRQILEGRSGPRIRIRASAGEICAAGIRIPSV